MPTTKRRRLLEGVALAGALVLLGGMSAAEEPRSADAVLAAGAVVEPSLNPYWLGIMATPVDEALKSQLNLDERMMVQSVMPNSPAAKAGIKEHDILLAFGETQIHGIEDLTKAVRENGDKEASLTVLRGGKKETLRVKPEQRPAGTVRYDIQIGPNAKGYDGLLRQWLQGLGPSIYSPDGSLRMQFFGPGFIEDVRTNFPDNLSITVTKEGNRPAKIVVKRGDTQWEVTEDTLHTLPEDIRPHVEGLLGRRPFAFWAKPPDGRQLQRRSEFRLGKPDEPAAGKRPRAEERDPLEDIRKQLDELRKEVDKLREKRGTGEAAKTTKT